MKGHCFLDSGASSHTFANPSFSDLQKVDGPTLASIGNAECQTIGLGTVKLQCRVAGRDVTLSLTNARYSPGVGVNLICLPACEKGSYGHSLKRARKSNAVPGDLSAP
ncbi:uncharacterized protein N7515_000022 [Penicillium bovifimosum]|uniref:Retrovirus-related Pol polyprotein from transposon TNT 1-94-like beta-barrel domain-containing protein n=1 Tax=Penicillium bovifimosum TaxID=126998 RepID=A0A9W9HEP0_9EURO|nr:uncharacterized protein N7515_000022 [Penicillium bovifimosum]KAJ5145458.1 hypothetical protein N7515_000022 [Penicillium bovifimosum]